MECAAIFPKFGISIYSAALWYLCVYTVVLKKSEKSVYHNFLPLEANKIDDFTTKKRFFKLKACDE